MSKSNTQNNFTQLSQLSSKLLGLQGIVDKIKIGSVGTLNAGLIAQLNRIDCQQLAIDLTQEVNHLIYSRFNEEIDKIGDIMKELENGNN